MAVEATLSTSLASEIARATSTEVSLEDKLDNVISNIDPTALDSLTEIVSAFQAADGDINNAITNLSNAAAADLSSEVSRATSSELSLASGLSREIVDRTDALSTELSRATAAEKSLTDRLSSEEVNRADALSTELSRALAAEASLTSSLSSEVVNRQDAVKAEESRALNAEDGLASDLAKEVADRVADVDSEELRALAAELVLRNDLSSEVANRVADVDAEENRALAAEASLEDLLSDNVSTINSDLSAEISRAEETEASIITTVGYEEGGNYYTGQWNEYTNYINSDFSSDISNIESNLDNNLSDLNLMNTEIFSQEVYPVSMTSSYYGDVYTFNSYSEAIDFYSGLKRDRESENSSLKYYLSQSEFQPSNLVNFEAWKNWSVKLDINNMSNDFKNSFNNLDRRIHAVISNIDPAALDSLTEIVEAFQGADSDLTTAIQDLSSAATTDLSNEVVRATSAELSLEDALKAEIERAEKAEVELSTELSNKVAYLLSNTDLTELDSFAEVSAELVSTVSDAIAELALVDEKTIVLNDVDNTISLAETIAAPVSGIRTFEGEVDVETILKVGGVDVMAEISDTKVTVAERLNITPVVSAFTIGDGVETTFSCEHALGTMDVIVQIYDITTGATVETESIRVNDQSVSIEFADAPASNSYRVVTMGIQAFHFVSPAVLEPLPGGATQPGKITDPSAETAND